MYRGDDAAINTERTGAQRLSRSRRPRKSGQSGRSKPNLGLRPKIEAPPRTQVLDETPGLPHNTLMAFPTLQILLVEDNPRLRPASDRVRVIASCDSGEEPVEQRTDRDQDR